MSASSFSPTTPTTPGTGTTGATGAFTTPGGVAGGGAAGTNIPAAAGINTAAANTNQATAGIANINQAAVNITSMFNPPAKPNIGNIDLNGPWSGGEPLNQDWLATKLTRPHSQACYRSGKDFRVYTARIKGLSSKFPAVQTPDSKVTITSFCSNVLRHLQLHGMDSVFYVKYSDGTLYNIIKNHTLFNTTKVLAHLSDFDSKFDSYDLDNLQDSKEFLLNSIDDDLVLQLAPFIDENTTGPEVFMRIINEVQSSSVERLVKVSQDVRLCKVKNFKGENIRLYAAHLITLCRDLDSGLDLPRDICLTIVDQLIDCSVEKFRIDFMTIRRTILIEMEEYHGKNPLEVKHLQKLNRYYSYDKLLNSAVLAYQSMIDLQQWGPNVVNTDTSAAPEIMIAEAEVNALIEKAIAKFKQQNPNVTPTKKGKTSWKTKAPKANEPTSKTVDGTEYHWCAKCYGGRWSATHGTDEHVSKPTTPTTTETNVHETGLYCQWAEGWVSESDNCCSISILDQAKHMNEVLPHLEDTVEILWDTGATSSVGNHQSDFVGPIEPSIHAKVMKGIAKGLKIEGIGKISYQVVSDTGKTFIIESPAFYVPDANRKIFSPQAYFQHMGQSSKSGQDKNGIWLTQGTDKISIPYSKTNNLPIFYASTPGSPNISDSEFNLSCVTESSNQNINPQQKELLRWHFRFGHMNFNSCQLVLKSGAVGTSPIIQGAGKCIPPQCTSCKYGKARKTPTSVITTKEITRSIDNNDLRPGQRVSVDHFLVKQKGRLFESKGKSSIDLMYSGGSLFVDHASGYISVYFQVQINALETILAKQKFEKELFEFGVIVQAYHTDNGIFTSQAFINEIESNFQNIRFCGVGSHHQNGKAERGIGTIFSIARTMLIHSVIRWPDVITPVIWPMAVSYATYLYNHMPKATGISPLELIVRIKDPRMVLKNAHVFGCPAFVLDPKLQTGSMIPKFSPRSRRGIFVGFSLKHSSQVPLILNLATLSITPQFHVMFDDWFTTVNSTQLDNPLDAVWNSLFTDSRYQYYFDEDDNISLDKDWNDVLQPIDQVAQHIDDTLLQLQREKTSPSIQQPIQQIPPIPSPINQPINSTNASPLLIPIMTPTVNVSPFQPPPSPIPYPNTPSIQSPIRATPAPAYTVPVPPDTSPGELSTTLRRSNREKRPPLRFGFDGTQGYGYNCATIAMHQQYQQHFVKNTVLNQIKDPTVNYQSAYLMSCITNYDDLMVEYDDPLLYNATTQYSRENDTLKYHQAVFAPDWADFQAAALTEIRTLEKLGTWKEVPRTSVPSTKKVLGGTWVFRRKRTPEGKIVKHKARFCVRGDQQVAGVDYFESYAPVTMWSTIRLMFIVSIIADLATVQVDYTNAFAQAFLKEEVYIEAPTGFSATNNSVLRLLKSLYGLVQAPRTFYEYLTNNLKKFGFICSINIDPCLWISAKLNIICIIWVDDCLFFSKHKSTIMDFIEKMKLTMPLTVEETVTAFLGIQVIKEKGKITLLQPSLINQVILATNLQECNNMGTPASCTPVGSDVNGEPFDEFWGYSSVIGMLNYLANNTRPDISYATHQCARFTHNPKKSHGIAVKHIIRYLAGTKDKGIIMTPSKSFSVDCYVDADFAGLYGHEDCQNPISVKSRTGYVLLLADCPLLWVSKLQSMVAVSTMEAEYIALSQAMRDIIPMRRLAKLACDTIFGTGKYEARIFSKVFEDNIGALQLARAPRMTPRTKHYGIKYHFFHEHVTLGDIKLYKVESKNQRADIFTKGLVFVLFVHNRLLLCGW